MDCIIDVLFGFLIGYFIGVFFGVCFGLVVLYYICDAILDNMLVKIEEWELMDISPDKILALLKSHYRKK